MKKEEIERLEKAGYHFIGKHKHSAVKLCLWTKKSIKDEGFCYKQKFYGIQSHRCLQWSPSVPFCTHNCIFCWRDTRITSPTWEGEADDPQELVDAAIEEQKRLISGFLGTEKTNREKWEEANEPAHTAISLAGEPTLYPYLSDLIKAFHKRGITTFLVTNGTNPKALAELDELPTQLYLSLEGPDKQTYKKTCMPLISHGWERINETLELFPSLNTRKVIRLTLVRGFNLKDASGYASLIKKAMPNYVEPKAYMHVGYSILRLSEQAMPLHTEIRAFAQELSKATDYIVTDEFSPSRVVLLSKDQRTLKNRLINKDV